MVTDDMLDWKFELSNANEPPLTITCDWLVALMVPFESEMPPTCTLRIDRVNDTVAVDENEKLPPLIRYVESTNVIDAWPVTIKLPPAIVAVLAVDCNTALPDMKKLPPVTPNTLPTPIVIVLLSKKLTDPPVTMNLELFEINSELESTNVTLPDDTVVFDQSITCIVADCPNVTLPPAICPTDPLPIDNTLWPTPVKLPPFTVMMLCWAIDT